MRFIRLISFLVAAALISAPALASPQGEKFRIDYRPNNYNYDATYKVNAETARRLYAAIEETGLANIDHIHVVASAVPGSSEGMAKSRSVDAKWLVLKHYPDLIGHVVFEEGSEGKDVAWITIVRKTKKDNVRLEPAADARPMADKPQEEGLIDIKPLSVPGSAAAICTIEAHIDYRLGKFNYDPDYMQNRAVTEALYYEIDRIGIKNIDSVSVVSYASPEGSYENNKFLATNRAIDSKWIILKKYPELIGHVSYEGRGESWDALRAHIAADTRLLPANVDRLLSIIDDPSLSSEQKKISMKSAGIDPNVGNIYAYLTSKYYPVIRSSTIVSFYLKPQEPVPAPVIEEVPTVKEPMPEPEPEPKQEPEPYIPEFPTRKKETLFAVKTNLLYDAVTMANVELEVPFAKRFSFMVEDVFPWWEFVKNKYALQNWEMGAEFRFWFKPWQHDTKKLKGFFVGPYAMSGLADFQYDTDLCYQFSYLSGGLSGGWVMPLGRTDSPWGRLEFSLSVGYLLAHYQHYQPSAGYDALVRDRNNSGEVTWIGPTKVKVSLVIPINFTTQKANHEQ